ncbi:MAG: TRAP transporter small permease [Eubacteriales bacterium]|nr:TRAP transporter small permease [Eubacteriales bacterium]
MKGNSKARSILCNIDTIVACIVLALLVVLTFAGVVYRRVLNAPFTWLEEVQTSCMVWIVFAAAGPAFRAGNQVAIEMVYDLFPQKAKKALDIVISVIVVSVLAYLFYQSIGFINIFVQSGRATPMLKIPYVVVYGIAPLSYIDMLVCYFWSLKKGVRSEAKEALEG